MSSNPTIESGAIRSFKIIAGQSIPNVLGLAFELDYDTTLLEYQRFFMSSPADSNYYMLLVDGYGEVTTATSNAYNGYSFVKADHLPITIDSGFSFLRTVTSMGFKVRPDVAPGDIPDSTTIRIKNLIAIDVDGNDLHIGSNDLVVYREGFVGFNDPVTIKTRVYPNPVNESLHIECEIETEVELYSVHGQFFRRFGRDQVTKPIDVSDMPPGIYILKIQATGESVKVIIE